MSKFGEYYRVMVVSPPMNGTSNFPIFKACIHLVISMAGSTAGQRFTVPGGLATEFFKEQLGPELLTVQEPPRGVNMGDDG